VDEIIAQIDAKLATMPAQVTASEARVIHNDRRTRGY
jgi:hypothetical protein